MSPQRNFQIWFLYIHTHSSNMDWPCLTARDYYCYQERTNIPPVFSSHGTMLLCAECCVDWWWRSGDLLTNFIIAPLPPSLTPSSKLFPFLRKNSLFYLNFNSKYFFKRYKSKICFPPLSPQALNFSPFKEEFPFFVFEIKSNFQLIPHLMYSVRILLIV